MKPKIQDIDENDDLLIWLDKHVNDCSLDLPKISQYSNFYMMS